MFFFINTIHFWYDNIVIKIISKYWYTNDIITIIISTIIFLMMYYK